MSTVLLKILDPRAGSVPLTVRVPAPVPGQCCYCGVAGRLRCSVCAAWYCTGHCQTCHWPQHRKECVLPPVLLWPDGARYQGEEVVMKMNEEGVAVVQEEEEKDVEQEMMSMDTIVKVGRAEVLRNMSTQGGAVYIDKLAKINTEKIVKKSVAVDSVASISKKEDDTADNCKAGDTMNLCKKVEMSGDAFVSIRSLKSVESVKETNNAVDLPVPSNDVAVMTIHQVTNMDDKKSRANTSREDEKATVEAKLASVRAVASKDTPAGTDTVVGVAKVAKVASVGPGISLETPGTDPVTPMISIHQVNANDEEKGIKIDPQENAVGSVAKPVSPSVAAEVSLDNTAPACTDLAMSVPSTTSTPSNQVPSPTPAQIITQANSKEVLEQRLVDEEAREVIIKLETNTTALVPAPSPVVSTQAPSIRIPRGSLPIGSKVMAVVCHLDSPSVFYICPTTSVDQFSNILTLSQDCPPGSVLAEAGGCCLVQDDDECWYRAEIMELVKEESMATLFMLDYGKTVQSMVTSLRPLPKELVSIEGLVIKVNLKRIKAAAGREWSKKEVEAAMLILDVGNDVTQFKVKVVKVDREGEMFVVMKNVEGRDVADLMAAKGIEAVEKLGMKREENQFKAGSLPPGSQMMIMLKMVSPMEMHLCTQEKFVQLSNSINMLEDAAAKAPPVAAVNIGDAVIACDEGTWYRAKVTKVMPDCMVQVELVDLASLSTLPIGQLRMTTLEVMKDELTAVSCCLDSWVGEDRKMAIEKWGFKVASLVEDYDELQVEVVSQVDEQFTVKIPDLEKKLKGESKNMAELLKERARKM